LSWEQVKTTFPPRKRQNRRIAEGEGKLRGANGAKTKPPSMNYTIKTFGIGSSGVGDVPVPICIRIICGDVEPRAWQGISKLDDILCVGDALKADGDWAPLN
jgi:hypothetical protein